MTENSEKTNTTPPPRRQLQASLATLQHGLLLLDSKLSESNPDFESVGMAMEVIAGAIEQRLTATTGTEEPGDSLDKVLARIGQPDLAVNAAAVLAEWVAAHKYGETIRYREAETARHCVYEAVEALATEWERATHV